MKKLIFKFQCTWDTETGEIIITDHQSQKDKGYKMALYKTSMQPPTAVEKIKYFNSLIQIAKLNIKCLEVTQQ